MSVIGVTHVQRWFYNSLGETTHLFGWLPDKAHATMYSFFKAKMPPKADGCEDSTTWHKNGDESKDCAWVAEWSPRCSVKGADKSLAAEHCTCACPN